MIIPWFKDKPFLNQTWKVNNMATRKTETTTTETITIEQIIDAINQLDFDGLMKISDYVNVEVNKLKEKEAALLEEQMREIQEKLAAIRGTSLIDACGPSPVRYKNPTTGEIANSRGKRPAWLAELLKAANGDKTKEKEILEPLKV